LLALSVTAYNADCPCATDCPAGEALTLKSAFEEPVRKKPPVAVSATAVTTTSPPTGVRAQAPRPFDRLTIDSRH
jgi:hypothetical protein